VCSNSAKVEKEYYEPRLLSITNQGKTLKVRLHPGVSTKSMNNNDTCILLHLSDAKQYRYFGCGRDNLHLVRGYLQ
jgi:hypothetical protein